MHRYLDNELSVHCHREQRQVGFRQILNAPATACSQTMETEPTVV